MTKVVTALVFGMLSIGSSSSLQERPQAEGSQVASGVQFTYEISITNVTRAQPLSPPVVVIHNGSFTPLFTLGSPASSELFQIAEDAVNGPMLTKLGTDPEVGDVIEIFGSTGPIVPGETAKGTLTVDSHFDRLSLVGMLVTTNDAFYAVNDRDLWRLPQTLWSPAFDAGSETNNEDCAFIPGPPCNNVGERETSGAEGYVHVHGGIHGLADLDPATHDWRNPVAYVTVRRIDD